MAPIHRLEQLLPVRRKGKRRSSDHDRGQKSRDVLRDETKRVFDHLNFRNRMRDAFGAKEKKLKDAKERTVLTLRKPSKISGKPAWFEPYYEDSQKWRDRRLFST